MLVKKGTPTEDAAVVQEQRVLDAVLRGDVEAMNAAIGPSVLMVGGDGIWTWTAQTTAAFMESCRTSALTGSDFQTANAGGDVVVVAYVSEGRQVCGKRATGEVTNALSVWQRTGPEWNLIAHSETPAADPGRYDGVYQYLPPLQGLAVYHGRHYNFLSGTSDGTSPLMANAGTYEVFGDTAVATIQFSTSSANRPGAKFRFLIDYLPGDTVAYTVIDEAGQTVSGGRTVKIR